MSYAVFNPVTGEVATVVREPTGTLPEGFIFLPENKLPATHRRVDLFLGVSVDEVDTWKLREVLAKSDLLLQVNALIETLPKDQKENAVNRWEYKGTIQRKHPLTIAIGKGLKLSEKQMDDLFIEASKVV